MRADSSREQRAELSRVATEWVKRNPFLYGLARGARLWAGAHLARPRTVAGVPGRVHPNDIMFATAGGDRKGAYLGDGRNALSLLDDALTAVDRRVEDVESWLDFGCGYGRVLRFLVERADPQAIWVTDWDHEAAAFCVAEFGVHVFHPARGGTPVDADGFDVAYAFSILTHLPERAAVDVMALLGRVVRPGGLLVFTTHGETSVTWAPELGRWCAGLAPAIRDEVSRNGFAYRSYPYYRGNGYGLAWHAPSYVAEVMDRLHGDGLQPVSFLPGSFGRHQDTFVYRRAS